MAKIRVLIEGLDQETADRVKGDLEALGSDIKVTIGEVAMPIMMPELTPEMEEALREEMARPGNIVWGPNASINREAGGDALTIDDLHRGKAWVEGRLVHELNDAPDHPPGMPILPAGWTQDADTGMTFNEAGEPQGVPIGWRSAPISPDDPAHPAARYSRFSKALEGLVNSCSMENGSDTPDFMIAAFLTEVLQAWDRAMQERDRWYGGSHRQLKAQLEAEGAHTEAADAEVEALRTASAARKLNDGY